MEDWDYYGAGMTNPERVALVTAQCRDNCVFRRMRGGSMYFTNIMANDLLHDIRAELTTFWACRWLGPPERPWPARAPVNDELYSELELNYQGIHLPRRNRSRYSAERAVQSRAGLSEELLAELEDSTH
jgi:hypothetical protein